MYIFGGIMSESCYASTSGGLGAVAGNPGENKDARISRSILWHHWLRGRGKRQNKIYRVFRQGNKGLSEVWGRSRGRSWGHFLTGPIHLRSNVCLEIGKGATILFSDRFEDYLPAVLIRWEGWECYNLSPLIYANGCRNIVVTGGGTLDGQGKAWWSWRKEPDDPYRKSNNQNAKWAQDNVPLNERLQGGKDFHWCPIFISPVKCQNVLIEGLTIIDGPFWNVHPLAGLLRGYGISIWKMWPAKRAGILCWFKHIGEHRLPTLV